MRYEQENNSVYMVIDGKGGVACADREMKMLVHNQMDSLLPVGIRSIDNRCSYYYDVTSRQQFGKMYEYKKITRKNVENIIVSLDMLQNEINEYMLNLDKVILKTECIYVDTVRDRLLFAYGAVDQAEEIEDFRHGLKRLFDFIIEHYDHSGSDSDVIFVYNVYQRIVQGDYDASNLKELVNKAGEGTQESFAKSDVPYDDEKVMECIPDEMVEDEKEVENKRAAVLVTMIKVAAALVVLVSAGRMVAPAYVPLPISDVFAFVLIIAGAVAFAVLNKIPLHRLTKIERKAEPQPFAYSRNNAENVQKAESIEKTGNDEKYRNYSADYEHEENLSCRDDEAGATVLLSDYLKAMRSSGVCLKYKEGDNSLDDEAREISVKKIPWIIGNMDANCDTVIHNRLVSHIHACITKVDGEYFIEDMNSTNGTYVNGERLLMNARQKISDSDIITFAAISYIVEMS